MKILFFGKFDFSSLVGGIERYVYQLRTHLPSGYQNINLVSNTENKPVFCGNTIKVRSWGRLASTSICPSMPFILNKLLRKEKPDVIHFQFPDPMAHLSYLLCPKHKVKLVVSWQSDIVKQRKILKLYQPLLNAFFKKVDAVIVHSEALRDSKQLECVPKNKIHVIPIGVEPPPVKIKDLRDTMPKGFILFSVGRHVSYKGYGYLIRAFSKLPEDSYLYLGGIGPETPELQDITRSLNLQNRVHFVGHIPEKDLGSYINACDVFCFSSISQNEAYGITQIEAMLLGKPVVGFELNNGTTFVNKNNETGLVVENKNIDAYAEALLLLKNTPLLRQKLGQQAKERAYKLFSIKEMVNDTVKLYEEVTDQPQ